MNNNILIQTIPVEKAKEWTKNWRNTHPDDARAFLIPSLDFLNAMKEMDIIRKNNNGTYSIDNAVNTGVRAYMAIDDQGEQKLLIVGTRKEKDESIYRDIIDTKGKSMVEGTGVFDFTKPCPNNCDCESPLNHEPSASAPQ